MILDKTTSLDLKGLDGLAELSLEALLIKGLAGGCAGQLLLPGVYPTRQSPVGGGGGGMAAS